MVQSIFLPEVSHLVIARMVEIVKFLPMTTAQCSLFQVATTSPRLEFLHSRIIDLVTQLQVRLMLQITTITK